MECSLACHNPSFLLKCYFQFETLLHLHHAIPWRVSLKVEMLKAQLCEPKRLELEHGSIVSDGRDEHGLLQYSLVPRFDHFLEGWYTAEPAVEECGPNCGHIYCSGLEEGERRTYPDIDTFDLVGVLSRQLSTTESW